MHTKRTPVRDVFDLKLMIDKGRRFKVLKGENV
jgi:hypothetical protein